MVIKIQITAIGGNRRRLMYRQPNGDSGVLDHFTLFIICCVIIIMSSSFLFEFLSLWLFM